MLCAAQSDTMMAPVTGIQWAHMSNKIDMPAAETINQIKMPPSPENPGVPRLIGKFLS